MGIDRLASHKRHLTYPIFCLALCLLTVLVGCDDNAMTVQESPNATGTQGSETVDGDTSKESSAGEDVADTTPAVIPNESYIAADELRECLRGQSSWVVIDMRDYSRYVVAHAPGVQGLPFRYLEKRLKEVPREQQLALIFENHDEAQQAWNILIANGYDPSLIRVMDDGFKSWMDSGFETEVSVPSRC
jgi:rhodanese-related sulfurtransferase